LEEKGYSKMHLKLDEIYPLVGMAVQFSKLNEDTK